MVTFSSQRPLLRVIQAKELPSFLGNTQLYLRNSAQLGALKIRLCSLMALEVVVLRNAQLLCCEVKNGTTLCLFLGFRTHMVRTRTYYHSLKIFVGSFKTVLLQNQCCPSWTVLVVSCYRIYISLIHIILVTVCTNPPKRHSQFFEILWLVGLKINEGRYLFTRWKKYYVYLNNHVHGSCSYSSVAEHPGARGTRVKVSFAAIILIPHK